MKKEKNGYEIIINHFVAKVRYDSYIKYGYVDEGAENITTDMLKIIEGGMVDINVEIYYEIFGKESEDIGMPVGFMSHIIGNQQIPMFPVYMVFYADFKNNKMFQKVIKGTKYHEYMQKIYEKIEEYKEEKIG